MRTAVIAIVTVAALAHGAPGAPVAPVAGQHVRGTVHQSDTGEPVSGAMVVLLDEAGGAQASVLTNEAGRFVLRSPSAGRFRLQVQRIGFRDVFTDFFELATGQTVERDVVTSPQAIVLEGITAEARRRCVSRPREGLAVATLWGEARKALEAAAVTEREAAYRFRVHNYRRDLELGSLRVRREEASGRVGYAERSPFISLAAERLLTEGFVHLSDTASYYYAPDAHVLLSDLFLDAYCFRVAEHRDEADRLIGLAFEPADRRGPPAVRGTLWLDRRSFELQHLEYGYTRVALPDGPSGSLGGRVEFEALPNGTWIVRRWWIRMPHVQNRATPWRAAGQRVTPTISGLLEEGGEVVEVMDRTGSRRTGVARFATLSGMVVDSASAVPLSGALVHLTGTERSVVADEEGRYRIEDLREGEYTVVFSHPRTDLYGFEPQPVPVSVRQAADVVLDLGIPMSLRGKGMLAACSPDVPLATGVTGLLRGTVVDEYTKAPVPGARITFSWEAADATGTPATMTRVAVADQEGNYVACGLPEKGSFQAQVALGDRRTAPVAVQAPGAAGFAEIDLTLRMTDPQPVVIIVLDFDSGRPIRDAVIALPGLELRGVTDRYGRVAFNAVEPGRHDLRIEHIAYGAHVRDLTVGTEPETFEVRVPTQVIALEGIDVTVRSVRELARRSRGVRVNVVDRDEIARVERTAEHVGHLAQRIPGLQVQETYYGVGGIRNGICVRSPRGAPVSGVNPGALPCAVVILDGIPLNDTEVLLALAPDAIEAIEFLSPVEAGPRYGTVAGQVGALLVWTRGNGPHAKRDTP